MPAVATKAHRNTQPSDRQHDRERVRILRHQRITFIPNASFADGEDTIDWFEQPLLKAVEQGDAAPRVPKVAGLAAHMMRMCETPILTVSEERAFFRRMNYLKWRVSILLDELNEARPAKRKLAAVEDLIERAERIRNHIIQANTRLVMSIAKKFSDMFNSFDDSLSQGITSLMYAIEKFDYDRGFRFSTYATTAIRRDLYRQVITAKRQRDRFGTGADDLIDSLNSVEASDDQTSAVDQGTYGLLTDMLDQLEPRENLIIRARFGFDSEGGRKSTFVSLAKQLGISKERVRQLAERALTKLRKRVPELSHALAESHVAG